MVPMLTFTSMLLRAVQRVEHQQVFALRVAVGHHVDAVHFLAGHGRQVAAPFVGLDQHFVGDDVQLLLDLALHVLALGRAQHAAERALVDAWLMLLQARATTSSSRRSWRGMRPSARCCSTR
jgi:hypothetical protein